MSTVTIDQLMALLITLDGRRRGSRDKLITAAGVCMAESGGRTEASCYNYRDPVTGKARCSSTPRPDSTSVDRGIWQINSRWHPEVSERDARDPIAATKHAQRISGGFNSWTPWTAYKNGAYRRFATVAGNSFDSLIGLDAGKLQKIVQTIGTGTTAGDVLAKPGPITGLVTGAVDSTAAVGTFLGKLLDGSTWLRVVQVIGGLGAVVVGVLILSNDLKGAALGAVTGAGKGAALGAGAGAAASAAL